MSDREKLLTQALAARDNAAALLRALQDAKGTAEAQPPSGKGDLYKRVTGASSLENAIAEARRTVDAYERLIGEMGKQETPEVVVRPSERAVRP
jgi:hypothetical protein